MLLKLAAVAVIGVLMCTAAPIGAAESVVTTTQQVNPLAPATDGATLVSVRTSGAESSTAHLGPVPQTPAKPTKRSRRRHHFWFWHLVPGSGGPLSWLLLVPYLMVGLGLALVIIFVRRRRTKASSIYPGIPAAIHAGDDRLQRLQDLHTQGMLSDDEFETQRLRILGT